MEATLKKDAIYLKLLGKIRSGELPKGTKLPPEVTLSASYSVGRITLRAALDRLEQEGLLKRIRGRGPIIAGNRSSQDRGTIVILYDCNDDISNPSHYLPQELVRFSRECNCTPFMMELQVFALYSIEEIRSFVMKEHVIGIIAIMNNFRGDEPILHTFHALKVPVILTLSNESDPEISGFPGIGVHEKEAVNDALKYLASQDIRSLGFLANADTFRGCTREELAEMLDACGIRSRDEWYRKVTFDRTEIFAAVSEMLNGKERPQAILCYTAYYAIHIYELARKLNLKIPDDLAVMGICGYLGTRLLIPKLVTVNFHYDRIAEKAVKMLLSEKANPGKAEFIEVKTNITSGKSIPQKNPHPTASYLINHTIQEKAGAVL